MAEHSEVNKLRIRGKSRVIGVTHGIRISNAINSEYRCRLALLGHGIRAWLCKCGDEAEE